MSRFRLAVVALLLVTAGRGAQAQIIQPNFRTEPNAWLSLGLGWLTQQAFCNADACYDFNGRGAAQWRASLEFPMGRGSSIGVAGTTARASTIYTSNTLLGNTCSGCLADANVSQFFGVLHMGSGTGIQQVIDLSAGATLYSNFRRQDTGTELGPKKTNTYFTFAAGYGFGYGLSENASLYLATEYALMFLPSSGNNNNYMQQYTLRFGGRYGVGRR